MPQRYNIFFKQHIFLYLIVINFTSAVFSPDVADFPNPPQQIIRIFNPQKTPAPDVTDFPDVADFLNPPHHIIRIFNPQNHQPPELTHHLYKIYPLYHVYPPP